MSDTAALVLMALSYALDASVMIGFTRIDRSARWCYSWAAASLLITPCVAILALTFHERSWSITTIFAVAATLEYFFLIRGALTFSGKSSRSARVLLSLVGVFGGAVAVFTAYHGNLLFVMGLSYSAMLAICAAITWHRGARLAEIVTTGLMLRSFSAALALMTPPETLLTTVAIASVGIQLTVSVATLFAALFDYKSRMIGIQNDLRSANNQLSETAARLERRTLQYEESRDRAEQADRSKAQFLARMGHELRTPLNAVIGYADLLRSTGFVLDESRRADYLDNISKAGGHLLSMVNEILDFSKLEFQDLTIDARPTMIEELVRDSISMIAVRAREKDISIVPQVEPGLTGTLDPQLIRQVLLNCLGNAVKFTPVGGSIRVEAEHLRGVLEMRVSDTGPGISPDARETIFTPFWQDGRTNASHLGLGLGLSISRRFVERHGGTIFAADAPTRGAMIVIQLPIEDIGDCPAFQLGDNTVSASSAQ